MLYSDHYNYFVSPVSFRIATSGKMEEYDIDDDYDNDWSYEYEKKGLLSKLAYLCPVIH